VVFVVVGSALRTLGISATATKRISPAPTGFGSLQDATGLGSPKPAHACSTSLAVVFPNWAVIIEDKSPELEAFCPGEELAEFVAAVDVTDVVVKLVESLEDVPTREELKVAETRLVVESDGDCAMVAEMLVATAYPTMTLTNAIPIASVKSDIVVLERACLTIVRPSRKGEVLSIARDLVALSDPGFLFPPVSS